MSVNLRDASRSGWSSGGERATAEELHLGAVLRIADAVEKLTQSYDALVRDRDFEKERRERIEKLLATERRRVAALRGVIRKRKGGRK